MNESIPVSRFLRWALGGLLAFGTIATAEEEEWIDVKDIQGRKLTVNIQSVDGDDVTFKTRNGKTYTFAITRFSVLDQLTLRKWKPPAGSDSPVEEDAELTAGESTDISETFQTKHFEFEVIGNGGKSKVESVAKHFEAVHWAFQQLPSDVSPKPAGERFKVKAFVKLGDFQVAEKEKLAEGQPAIYNLSRDLLVAPLELLESSPALTREIAYLLLGQRLSTLPPWYAVALTEYLASAPFKEKYLDLEDPLANMLAYLESAYGLGSKNMPMLHPNVVLQLDYRKLRAPGLEGNKARSSALLTYYFFNFLDNDGKNMDGFLRAVRTKADVETTMGTLTMERDEAKLADELRVAYIPKKLRVAFIK